MPAKGTACRQLVVLVLIQAGREWLLTDDENLDFLLCFAFIPARYDTSLSKTEPTCLVTRKPTSIKLPIFSAYR